MSSESESMENPSKTISEGIVLVFLSAVSYAGAYLYEFGYAGHFGIPKEYVYVDTRGLIVFFVIFLSVLTVVCQLLNFIQLAREGDSESPIRKLLKKHAAWFGIPLIFAFLAAAPLHEWINIFLLPIIILAGDVVGPFILRKRMGGFKAALDDWMKDGGTPVPMPINGKLIQTSWKGTVSLVYLMLLLLFIANAMGAGEARRKTDFLFSGNENKIVLRRYGTDWLFAEYDPVAQKIEPNFSLVDFTKEKTELKLIKISAVEKVEARGYSTKTPVKDFNEVSLESETNTVDSLK